MRYLTHGILILIGVCRVLLRVVERAEIAQALVRVGCFAKNHSL
jgi:hypothetical protein